jgi:hypothetical protein
LDQLATTGGHRAGLGRAPVVYVADFMDTADGAVRGTAFGGQEFALNVNRGVVGKRDARITPLLAAIVHQAVLANVEVTGARPATPVVGAALGDGGLEVVETGVVNFLPPAHLFVDFRFVGLEWLELTVTVMDDADGRGKAELDGAPADDERFLGIADAAADNGVDVDVELRIVGQHLEFLVEHLEGFFGNVVGLKVVDRNLHVIEARAVQALDAFDVEQVAIGDHACDGAGAAHAGDDFVELRVGQRFAARDSDHSGAETAKMVDAAIHFFEWDRVADFVVLIAIRAGKITEAGGNDLGEDRVARGGQGAGDHTQLARFAGCGNPAASSRISAT